MKENVKKSKDFDIKEISKENIEGGIQYNIELVNGLHITTSITNDTIKILEDEGILNPQSDDPDELTLDEFIELAISDSINSEEFNSSILNLNNININ
jgi:hypothetical protein